MAGIGRGSNSSIEGKRGGNLGNYHTSDCFGHQQPVSHDSSLGRLQPVAWVLEGFHCYSQSRGEIAGSPARALQRTNAKEKLIVQDPESGEMEQMDI